jgi:hypothetical protein
MITAALAGWIGLLLHHNTLNIALLPLFATVVPANWKHSLPAAFSLPALCSGWLQSAVL